MDELGYLSSAGSQARLPRRSEHAGDRVIIDIGMHLGLRLPDASPFAAGEVWTPDLALEFFTSYCGRDRRIP